MNFRPIDASKECGVTVNTIRNWCRSYAEFLSVGASVESDERVLNGQDIEILKYIATLRLEKMQKPQIAQRLRETSFGLAETIDSPQIGHEIALQDVSEAPQSTPGAIVALDAINAIRGEIEALKASVKEGRQSQRDYVQGIAVGFIGAGILFGLLIGLAVLYGGFR